MTDERPPAPRPADDHRPPVPQFGEYASPEEQQRRMQANPRPVPPAPVAPAPESPARGPVLGSAPRPRLGVDRIVTIGLLVYGLINTITSIPQMADYVSYSDMLLGMMGIDASLSDPAGARGWGIAAAIVMGLGWLATAALSYLRMRAGRLAFWVPLVGAVVFIGITGVLLAIPLLGDPAILHALAGAGG